MLTDLTNILAEAVYQELGGTRLGIVRATHSLWAIVQKDLSDDRLYFIKMETATIAKVYCTRSGSTNGSGVSTYSGPYEFDISDPACIDQIIALGDK